MTYTPDLNWYGTEEVLTFYGSSSTGTTGPEKSITINVTAVDDPMVVLNVMITDTGTQATIDLKNYTQDIDNDIGDPSYEIFDPNVTHEVTWQVWMRDSYPLVMVGMVIM